MMVSQQQCKTRLFVALLALTLAGSLDGGPARAEPVGLLAVVRRTLQNDPLVRIAAKQLEVAEAEAQEASGHFDTALRVSAQSAVDDASVWADADGNYDTLVEDSVAFETALDVPFRSGITFSPSVRATHTESDLSEPLNEAEVSFTLRIPLLRGWGRGSAAAREAAARVDVAAARCRYAHDVAARILATTEAYWGYLAAHREVTTLESSEKRTATLNGMLAALVEAGELAKADLQLIEAYGKTQEAQRIEAERRLFAARQALGLAVGMAPGEAVSLPPPGDAFPDASRLADADEDSALGLKEPALRRRADFLALQHRCTAWDRLAEGARNASRPGLDAVLGVGYTGWNTDDGSGQAFTAFGDNAEGATARLALEFDYPLRNRAALGRYRQTALRREICRLERDDLKRRIGYAIDVDVDALRALQAELIALVEAERLYARAFENEREKLQIGMATPIDLLTAEGQLTGGALDRIGAQRKHAVAIARLRFDSGMLLEQDTAENMTVTEKNLLTVPVPPGDRDEERED